MHKKLIIRRLRNISRNYTEEEGRRQTDQLILDLERSAWFGLRDAIWLAVAICCLLVGWLARTMF